MQDYVQTRCSPKRLKDVLRSLNDLQIDGIKEIGLGSLLELKRVDKVTVNRFVVSELFDRFDLQTYCINVHGTQIKVSLEDVEYILGLRVSGTEINLKDANELGELSVDNLQRELHSLNGDEFKYKFALFALGCFLCPNSTLKINQGMINALQDIDLLINLNWGRLVFQRLIDGIRKYKGKDNDSRKGYVYGCTYFLEVSNCITSIMFLIVVLFYVVF